MIYIHGVNHNTQHRGKVSNLEGASMLESFVESICVEKGISVVAEEFSTETCDISDVDASVCHQIASRIQLRHLYCDPISSERAKLGIPSQADIVAQVKKDLGVSIVMGKDSNEYYDQLAAKYHCIREHFWLAKLVPYKGDNVLFICGIDHIGSFSEMLVKHCWQLESV